MTPKISIVAGKPRPDALPVVHITNYPLAKDGYKPYVQAKFCLSAHNFFMRLLSFEAEVMPDSRMIATFCLSPDTGAPILVVEAFCEHAKAFVFGSTTPAPLKPICRFFAGEDLQGIYWGTDILLDTQGLGIIFPQASFAAGARWRGNLYKLCDTPPFVHQGCLFPADFTQKDFITTSFGDFELIDY